MKIAFDKIKKRIAEVCQKNQRSIDEIELIAVSKGQSSEKITQLFALGQRKFGENYCDELLSKAQALAHLQELNWVYIGQLQSNKITKLMQVVHEIQSVSSLKHARYISRSAEELGKTSFPIYLLVNAGDEPQKAGVSFDELPALAASITREFPLLRVKGIMAIPPPESAIPIYERLKTVATTIGEGKLSVGMSQDLEIAIACGSDVIRIGTALFGERSQ